MNSNEAIHETKFLNIFDLNPIPNKHAIITIGNFDGVHLGHQAIIRHMLQKARTVKAPVIVVTFFPDPSDYFDPQTEYFYLSTPEEKETVLLELGVDSVVTFDFNRDFSSLTPLAFLGALKQKLGLSILIIGRDFALGKNRQGTLSEIKALGDNLSFIVETIEPVNFKHQEISSTNIRHRLDEGDVACAAKMLGRYYTISGVVIHGSDRGLRIGLPTANISHWPKKKLPAIGVYVTKVILCENTYLGITNVGFRPTFENQEQPNIETHILDFDSNIYGEQLTLQFLQKIRDEQKFESTDAFLAQIERDKVFARKIFGHDAS